MKPSLSYQWQTLRVPMTGISIATGQERPSTRLKVLRFIGGEPLTPSRRGASSGSSHTWERRNRPRLADEPALRAIFNSADQSDPVDRGLPLETCSLKMSVQPLCFLLPLSSLCQWKNFSSLFDAVAELAIEHRV